MLVWRICPSEDPEPFSGKGPQRNGQRWNPPGDAVVYTAECLALAALEFFVNLDGTQPGERLCAIAADVPPGVRVEHVVESKLPPHWQACPAPDSLQEIGADWVRRGESAVLVAPSAIIPEERIYILNPAHPQFGDIRVLGPREFAFDPRMWK